MYIFVRPTNKYTIGSYKNYLSFFRELNDLSISFLNESYLLDEGHSIKLICRQSEHFHNTSCLDMAVSRENYSFLSHGVVQHLLNEIWTGCVKGSIHFHDVVLALLCPLYILRFKFLQPGQYTTSIFLENTKKVDNR